VYPPSGRLRQPRWEEPLLMRILQSTLDFFAEFSPALLFGKIYCFRVLVLRASKSFPVRGDSGFLCSVEKPSHLRPTLRELFAPPRDFGRSVLRFLCTDTFIRCFDGVTYELRRHLQVIVWKLDEAFLRIDSYSSSSLCVWDCGPIFLVYEVEAHLPVV